MKKLINLFILTIVRADVRLCRPRFRALWLLLLGEKIITPKLISGMKTQKNDSSQLS